MSTVFEDLTPPLELCKIIPANEFDESIFVWVPELPYAPGFNGPKTVLPRCVAIEDNIIAPAPTLQEILESMGYNLQDTISIHCNPYLAAEITCLDNDLEEATEKGEELAEAALRMWLRLNGAENANIN